MKIQEFFAAQHGGKSPEESVIHGETFTAHYVIEFAKKWQNRNKKEKSSKVADPCYARFVDIWNNYFPGLLDFPRDGKHFKSLIKKTEELLIARQKEVTEDSKCNTFEYVVKWSKTNNHWVSGQPAGVFDAKYKSVIYEMQFGKQKSTFSSQTSSERAFSKYGQV